MLAVSVRTKAPTPPSLGLRTAKRARAKRTVIVTDWTSSEGYARA